MRILSTTNVFTSPYCSLVAKTLDTAPHGDPHYVMMMDDYVCTVARTVAGEFVLVRQYRPVIEGMSLELPAGHVDAGEDPAVAAARELEEETGHRPDSVLPLGCLDPDTGRLGNRQWCFFADNVIPVPGWIPEEGVETLALTPGELRAALRDGSFRHALHLAALFLAVQDGCLAPDLLFP